MKITADKAIPYAEHLFSNLGDVELADVAALSAHSLRETDCLVVRSVTRVDRNLLHGTPVGCIASATSGVDHVDVDYLRARGIPLFPAPGCNARAVAEYVLSCLFVLAEQYDLNLQDKTVGIIGCGHVGGRLQHLLRLLEIETRVYDPFITDEDGRYSFRDLERVLSADIISLHVPLTRSGAYPTARMVDRKFLGKLKTDVIFINSARGAVVDENALLDFVRRNPECRLALDVWDNEPDINAELPGAATLATPHIAGYSARAKLNATRMTYEQVRAWAGAPAMAAEETTFPGENMEFDLSGVDRPVDAARLATLACYDVRTDCAGFREMETSTASNRRDVFISARQNYQLRREFSDLRALVHNDHDDIRDKLSGLGFDVASHTRP